MRPRSHTSGRRVRYLSERPISTSSRSARRTKTRRSVRRAIRTTHRGLPAVRAADRLRTAGAHVANIDLRHATDIAAVYLLIVMADAAEYHAATLDAMPERYTPPVRLRLEMGRYVLAEDYVRALAGREVLRREVDAALAQHDALVLPTMPIAAPLIGANTVMVSGSEQPVRNMMLRLTQLFNVTGHP